MNQKRKPQEPYVTKEEKELQECTFKPKTKNYVSPFNDRPSKQQNEAEKDVAG